MSTPPPKSGYDSPGNLFEVAWALVCRFFQGWTWKMAWRDSRASRKHLLLFSTSITLGIGALVAVSSLGRNLESHIDEQARTLLGADLVVNARQPFTQEQHSFFRTFGGEQSYLVNFSSMIGFENGGGRLVQVRALDGNFPFYGEFVTDPPTAAGDFRSGAGALVEANLLSQFNGRPGDTISLGGYKMKVAGSLISVPGESEAFSTLAPRVYVTMRDMRESGLLQPGSLVRFRMYFKFGPDVNMRELIEMVGPNLEGDRLSYDTVEKKKRDIGRAMSNLYHFLNLTGFVALLLGGVGVASAINVHIREKLNTVAVLRCLGCDVRQSFAIYLAQGMTLGVIGSILGACFGLLVQLILPRIVQDFVPFEITVSISWLEMLKAMGIGFSICVLFALLPLLPVRRVPPLAAIRSSFEPEGKPPRDWLLGFVYLLLAGAVTWFSISQTREWETGVGFAAGLAIVFALLAISARFLMFAARKTVPAALPYVWRQGLSNLYRPNNRTTLMLVSLGLGTFLIVTLYLGQHSLLTQLFRPERENQANAILFDIQPDQRAGVSELMREQKLRVLHEAPVISMRLAGVKGVSVESMLQERGRGYSRWALRRDYRSSYRNQLTTSEESTSGTWPPPKAKAGDAVPISLEDGIARELGVQIGDTLDWDVQGLPLKSRVAHLRKVDWRKIEPNFFVVFPEGVLEEAPAFYILSTQVASAEDSARLQRELFKKFPNVSTIDLMLVLQTLNDIMDKAAFVIQFMALFSVGTGLLVLIGTVMTSRFQRIRESILLRTLGATTPQIRRILFTEYLCLGLIAGTTGSLLAVAANWAIAKWVFKITFVFAPVPVVVALISVSILTVVVGMLANRGVSKHPPLEILRAEV